MRVGRFEIGSDRPVFVLAEIGVNHDGSVDRAVELVRLARRAGADGVKVQVFRAERLLHPSASFARYQAARCEEANPAEMLRRYELDEAELAVIVEAARGEGLAVAATPFSPEDVETIERLGVDAVKIASPDVVNKVLLERAAKIGKPVIVSTGAATMAEVERAAGWLRRWGVEFALLHCVSSYPCTIEDAHLGWIGQLRERFEDGMGESSVQDGRVGHAPFPIGFSDHTTKVMSGALAVAAGACMVEKHLTYDPTAVGPDHSASAGPEEFAEYVKLIRLAERLRGRGPKRVLDCEADVRRVSRQSLVLRRTVAAGKRITKADLTVQRPGTGVCASRIDEVAGGLARTRLEAGTMLGWEMVE